RRALRSRPRPAVARESRAAGRPARCRVAAAGARPAAYVDRRTRPVSRGGGAARRPAGHSLDELRPPGNPQLDRRLRRDGHSTRRLPAAAAVRLTRADHRPYLEGRRAVPRGTRITLVAAGRPGLSRDANRRLG